MKIRHFSEKKTLSSKEENKKKLPALEPAISLLHQFQVYQSDVVQSDKRTVRPFSQQSRCFELFNTLN